MGAVSLILRSFQTFARFSLSSEDPAGWGRGGVII